ncbi:hypothetical protein Tco_0428479 [Tanacetum coccineum]
MGGSYYPIPCSILSTEKDRKTPQRYPDVPTTSWRISIRSMDSFQGPTAKSPSLWHRPLAPKYLALYDNESWNDLRDFAKPVNAITLPQDVPSTFDRRLIELENKVQRLMEAHLALTQPTQVNKITTACEICSGPHDTQYCMENPEQAFVEYMSSCTDEAGGLVSEFMASQHARLSKFEADFKQQLSEMTNKIDTVLKAITDRIAGTLPSDTVKNPKLGTTIVLSARSYPTKDPQCSTHIHSSINTITIHPKQPEESQDNEPDVGQEENGNLGNINLNPHLQPDPLASIATELDDGEVMFIEIIRDDDKPQNESPNEGEGTTMEGPAIMRRKLNPREDANGVISNFTGRIKGMHIFIGNFTYIVDFMIIEDISSIIDPRLSQVVLRKPFIEISNMTHDPPE